MTTPFRLAALIVTTGLLTACQTTPEPEAAAPPPDSALMTAQIDQAARALERYCVGGLPDVEAIAIVMSADAGPATGKAYTPYEGPNGFIGASLRAADGFSANASRKEDGRIVCGVALFTPMQGEFETAVLDRLVEENGLEPRDPRREADGATIYSLDRFETPATLSFRTRANEAGEPAIGAVITVAEDGGPLPLPEAPPIELAAAEPQEPPAPTLAEPSPPAEVATRQPEPAAPAKPAQTIAAASQPQVAPPPAPLTASKPAPTLPKAANPPSLAAAPSLYENAPYAAFTPAQIAEFCKQDWRTRREPGGRTEYNPCYERGAFR